MKKTPGDIIILLTCTKYHDHMLNCSWDMVRDRCICYFSFWAIFYPLNSLKNENCKKLKKKKTLGSIIILHKWTKNHDHMLYCSWDKAHDICNYFSFWAIFCPFSPLTAQKKKKKKNHLEISSFYICTKNYD